MSFNLNKKHIMIEYHDVNSTVVITLEEFTNKKKYVANSLKHLLTVDDNKTLSQFVAINYDVESYFIPILVSGIIDSNAFSFIFKPKTIHADIFSKLTINLIFSHQFIPNHTAVFEFSLYNRMIYLLKNQTLQVEIENSIEHCKSSLLKFCYAITTSGTTGTPKIVRVTKDCINVNIADFSNVFKISQNDKIAQLTPLTFDPCMVEILLAINNSCTLFMASDKVKQNSKLLLDKLIDSKVTIFQTTPSLLLSKWSKQDLRNRLMSKDSSLRVLLLGGEPLCKNNIISEIKGNNSTRIISLYGITEVSCWASWHEIILENESIQTDCIGEPLSKTIFQVRNTDDKIVEDGEGVLYIGSQSRICVIDDESNDVHNLPLYRNTGDIVKIKCGKIYYIGRFDATIKRLGNKVNLSKLESHVEKNDIIEKCVAIWNKEHQKLHIFITTNLHLYDVMNIKSELRKHLRSLPNCYQPDEIHFVKRFSLTEHGKICKSILQETSVQREEPRKNMKTIVWNVWEEHLGCIDDNSGFVDLGGNSITAMQIANTLSDVFKIDLSGLINILLNNKSRAEIFEFVSNECNARKDLKTETVKNIDEAPHIRESKNLEVIKHENQLNEVSELKCIWQKGRGDNSNDNNYLMIEKIIVDKSFDLEKCVDASPTVFKCSNGTMFATIGSHSGMIMTVSMNKSDPFNYYQMKLPDRIEASVLILDGFLGVVGCYDGYIYCVDLNSGNISWKFQTGNMVKCTAIKSPLNERLFVGSYDTYMYCLDSKDGHQIWRTKVSTGSITAKSRFNNDNNLLLVATLDGTCAALDITSGDIRWLRKLSHPVFSSPAVLQSGHIIFCSVIGDIVCFDIIHDLQLWTYSTKLNIFSYPVIHRDPLNNRENIVVVAHDALFRFECDDENVHDVPLLRYKIKLQNTTFCTPWCEGNIIVIADSAGMVYILSFHDGIILAEIKLNAEIFSSPVLCNDNILIGCRDNQLYSLKVLCSS